MTHEEKINYMRISAGICGFGFEPKHLDLLVSIYELILEKKGKTDIDDLVHIEAAVKSRDDAKKRSNLLDQVAKKVNA
jgi:hypothetical protein